MYGIALPAIADDDRRTQAEIELQAQGAREADDDIEGRIGAAALDGGDVGPGDADLGGDRLLREAQPRVARRERRARG